MCNCPENTPNPCNDCPPIITPDPNQGCLQPIVSSCVTYDGEGSLCANISEGQTVTEIIETLAENDCDLQNQINNIPSFSCQNLNTCELNDLGNVNTNPTNGQYLMFDGTAWVSNSITQFNCNSLNSCSINSLGDVNFNSPNLGDVITFNGTNWINSPQSPGYVFNCSDLSSCDIDDLGGAANVINGLNGNGKSTNQIKLGGSLIENTIITGSNFDLTIGTSISKINEFKSYSDILNFRTDLISLNESDESTQNKGLRFDLTSNSISLGTNVFDNFSKPNIYRIGENIQINDTVIGDSNGVFIGLNNTISSSIGFILGNDSSMTASGGILLGSNLNVTYGGATFLGTDILFNGGGTGQQSLTAIGNKITVDHSAFISQGNLVFNPTSIAIKSSPLGNTNNHDKIRVDSLNKTWTTFHSSGYYLFTQPSDSDGWSTSKNVVKIMNGFIKISESSNPSVSEEEPGCFRYNSSLDKYQGFTSGSGWVNLH